MKVEVHKICMAYFVLGKKYKASGCDSSPCVFFARSVLAPFLCMTDFCKPFLNLDLQTLLQRLCLHGCFFLFFCFPEIQSEVMRVIKLLFLSVLLFFIFYINNNFCEIVNKIYSKEKLTSIPGTFKHCQNIILIFVHMSVSLYSFVSVSLLWYL